jgi:beta-galactosidase GanA
LTAAWAAWFRTRRRYLFPFGKGKAIYVGPHLKPADLGRVAITLTAASGVKGPVQPSIGIEITRRKTSQGIVTFVLNHTSKPQSIEVGGMGKDLISSAAYTEKLSLEPYGVAVLQRA